MKNISFTRIKQLWIQTAVTFRKQILFNLLGIICAMFFANLSATNRNIDMMTAFYFMFFCIILSLSLSSAFRQMQTKEARLTFLTLPASPAEKFIANVVWAIVVPIVLFIVSAVAIDLLHALFISYIGGNNPKLLLPIMLRNCSVITLRFGNYQTSGLLIWILFHTFSFSLFLLGSCLWYKKVFLKTIAAIGIVTFLLMISAATGIGLTESRTLPAGMQEWLISIDTHTIITLTSIFLGLCTVVVWYLSYRLFKRREIISQKRKWLGFIRK